MDLKRARGKKLYDFAGSTGPINGVPTTAGSFTSTVQVKDETRAADTETFTIEILPPEAPTITTEALPSGTVGEFYCCGNLFASGGVQPYTWSVVAGTLPPGLTLPKRENTISGPPTTAGTFTFTVCVTDDLDAFSEKELSITIS
jgi:Putative Ig domain